MAVLMLAVIKFRKTVAEISAEGIREHASKVSKGLIRWEEIADVGICGMDGVIGTNSLDALDQAAGTGDKFIGIILSDSDAYAQKLNPVQRGLMALNVKTGIAHINLPCNLLGDDSNKFVELCDGYLTQRIQQLPAKAGRLDND